MRSALSDPSTQGLTRTLRRLALLPNAGGMADGELLERYLADRDEAAFEMLVRRHGPMVLGVCRRLLGDPHDAEDAFQAVFMVLVRKADSIVPRGMVGNWLYGVANRTALKARSVRARVKRMERQVDAMPETETSDERLWSDLAPVLDVELSRLPAEYRAAVVLCDLEGKSRSETARQLGLPEGTVSSRLARGRNILKQRLTRRGLALSVATLATAFAHNQAMASVPPTLVASTVQTASLIASGSAAAGVVSAKVAALAEGVIRAMFLSKLKAVASLLLAIGVLASGAGFLTHQSLAQKPVKPAAIQEGKKGQTELNGTVRAVDTTQQTITIQSKSLGEKTVKVASGAKVILDNGTGDESGLVEGKLADLTDGTAVNLKLTGDQKVESIRAEGPTVQGIVNSLNTAAKLIQVTIRPGKGEPEEKTFAVAANARVSIADGKVKEKSQAPSVTLTDVPVGAFVTLKLSADRQTVGSIFAEGPTVRGVVKGVDPIGGTLTLAVSEGKQQADKTFNVKNASVAIFDTAIKDQKSKVLDQKLADLPVGAVATLRLSPGQDVLSVSAEGPTVSGTVKRVDAAAKRIALTLAVKGEPERELEYQVTADVHVTIDGTGDRTLGDLPTGSSVTLRLSADQKSVRGIDADGPSVQGTATIVDSSSRSITITDKVGSNIYQVAKDAQIAIDGKTSEFGLVPIGAVIRARLSADRTTVRSMSADGPAVRGKLVSVDATSRTVTIYVGKVGDQTFDITQDARVATEVYGLSLKLLDLRPEKEVSLMLTADRKMVSRITVHGE